MKTANRLNRRGRTANGHPALESLEQRKLLSAHFAEREPNNAPANAIAIDRVFDAPVVISGRVSHAGDRDWFRIDLERGDVFGASLTGTGEEGEMDTMLHLFNSSGELVMGNDDSLFRGASWLPPESPLPRDARSIRDSEVYCIITAPGTYYFEVSTFEDETAGEYQLDLLVARPGMESKPVGARQILFLDFDGGSVPFNEDTYALASLITSLAEWGLNKNDLSAVITETVARVTEKLSTWVRAHGLNGDFAASGTPGEFGIEIRNSLQHADPFGADPLAARIVVGKTENQALAEEYIGLAEFVDVGNYKTDDQAVVSTNFIAGLLDAFPIAKPGKKTTIIDFAAEYMADVIAHEFGHLTGCYHTGFTPEETFEEPVNLMGKAILAPMGPDLVFGTDDDIRMQFWVDPFSEGYTGLHDTLNTVAFGLSTGMGAAAESAVSPAVRTGRSESLFGTASADSTSAFDYLDPEDELEML